MELLLTAAAIIVPTLMSAILYFASGMSKRLERIDTNLNSLVTQHAVLADRVEAMEGDPQAWHLERDKIRDRLHSVEVALR